MPSLSLCLALLALPAEGGAWWAFRPLISPPVPGVDPSLARTPIDAFIIEKLAEKGLGLSPEAERRTLIRRLTYDLHGLPPAPEEVEAYLADGAPDAYQRLVDRLLASPRYGERWGRHWLDVVHYGETHGYDKDKRRPHAWPYRDYVIRALNRDKPYARFVTEQLAGDVLHPDDPDGVAALGFIAAGPWDFVGHVELREGTVDKELTRSNDRDDMVATAMSTFVSLTVHCARCHDHKFDPIPTEEYYGLQAVFAGVERAERPHDPDPAVHLERRSLAAERKALAASERAVSEKVASVSSPEVVRIDARLRELEGKAAPEGGSPTNGYHSAVESGKDVEKWVQVDLGEAASIDEVRLVPARPTDFPDTPGFGFPARFRVALSEDPLFRTAETIEDRSASTFPNPGDRPHLIPAGGRRARLVRVTALRLWKRTGDYAFALGEVQVLSGGKNLAGGAAVAALDSIESGRWGRAHLVDGYSSRGRLDDPARKAAEDEVRRLAAERRARVDSLLEPETRAERDRIAVRLAEVDRMLEALPPPVPVYAAASEFAPSGSFAAHRGPRPVHVLLRGDVKSPREPATPGGLSCVSGLPHRFELEDAADEGARRAALARWIVDPRNPLAWRSITNRIWHYHFGRGLVDTPNDFGRMGSPPSHPQLLDWLSSYLLEKGGSLKALHRLILSSAVYRQASREDQNSSRIDSENRYLWRMNRARLDAEAIRDAVQQVSGSLDLAMGGPSADHFLFKDDHSPVYDYAGFDVESPASRRRSIYRSIVRSVPDPFMDCLDCADPSIHTPRRNTTLTALQALALLNNPFMVRQAELFAERLLRSGGDLGGRIDLAFRLALGRPPAPAEAELLGAHAARHGLPAACRLLLNSNEFLFVD